MLIASIEYKIIRVECSMPKQSDITSKHKFDLLHKTALFTTKLFRVASAKLATLVIHQHSPHETQHYRGSKTCKCANKATIPQEIKLGNYS